MPRAPVSRFIAKHSLFVLMALSGSMAEAQFRSDLRLFSEDFISPTFESTQKTGFQFAGIHLESAAKTEEPFRVDLQGAVAFGSPLLNYLNIRELYFQAQQSDTSSLSIGRKRALWNDLDQRWNLGLWQPLFQWNPLSAEQQGLSGIFWQAERENYAITVFGSPLYLPNQGPSFEVSNGAFVDGSPWFRRPPESIKIFKETTGVDYTLEKPSDSQVVFKTSYGAKFQMGSPEGIFFQLSSMYKPANELALGYVGVLNTDTLRAQVRLKPQVYYHSVSGADLSHRWGSFRYGLSGVLDRPDHDVDFDPDWTKPVYHDAVMVSPFVEWIRPSLVWTLQAINIDGGEVTESGPSASSERAPLTLRYPYQQALMTSVENRFSLTGIKRLASKLSYTYSDKNKFEFLQWQLRFRWSSLWDFFSELELVRAEDVSLANQNRIAQFRNLDRILIGASYAF
jgi:hypothetical protein